MAATVSGGFWPQNGVVSLTTIHTLSASRRRAAQALNHKGQYALRELMETLNGAVAGASAVKALTRVAHAEDMGGVRAIESESLVNRVTTTADRTDILADILTLSTKTYDPTPVVNGDDNPLGTR